MERRRAGRRGVYIPNRALLAAFVGMFVLCQPRCQPCLFASETATFALPRMAEDARKTLTPSQFAPESDNKW